MGKRQESALLTRKKLIDAMKEILSEKSADSVNIEDITKRAGVAKGSFYTYFKRKEDVISVIAFESYDVIRETVLNSSDSPLKSISDYLMGSVKLIDENTLEIAQNWMKSVVSPLPEETAGISKYNYDKEAISAILKKAADDNSRTKYIDIPHVTQVIMDCYYGAVALWCITGGETDLIDNMANFCSGALRSILE